MADGIDGKEYRWLIPVVFVVNVIVLFFSSIPLLNDPDLPWHLASGALILDSGHIPHTDPWAFTSQGQTPWYLLSWLWDVFLVLIERHLGTFAVYLTGVTLSAGLVAFLTARLLALGVDIAAVLLTVMLASLSMLEFATARPHMAGYILLLAFHALLHHSRADERYGRMLWLPPLMLLWVNLHGSFIAGFTVLGAFIAEAAVRKRYRWMWRLTLITAACGVCLLGNPYGFEVITGANRTLASEAIHYIKEWQPFTLSASIGVSAWLAVFVLAGNFRTANASLADKILAAAWFFATLQVMRNGALWILASAPYLAASLDQQTRDLREKRPPSPLALLMQAQPLKYVWGLCAAAYVTFITANCLLPHQHRVLSEDHSALDAIEYAQAHYPARHYLTDFNYGGQVIYFTGAKLPMFMDSRAGTAYTEPQMLDYIEFLLQRPGWQERLKIYGIDAIMAGKDTPFAQNIENGQFKKEWQLVFAGKTVNVYIAAPLASKQQ